MTKVSLTMEHHALRLAWTAAERTGVSLSSLVNAASPATWVTPSDSSMVPASSGSRSDLPAHSAPRSQRRLITRSTCGIAKACSTISSSSPAPSIHADAASGSGSSRRRPPAK